MKQIIIKTLTLFFRLSSSTKVEADVLFSTILYLSISAIIPPHVYLFVISFLYLAYLLYCTGSILRAIFYCFFPFWLLNVGRIFSYLVVPAEAIINPIYPNGRSIYFTFSPFFIIACVAVIICYVMVIRELSSKITRVKLQNSINISIFKNKYILFFLLTFTFLFISSTLTPFFTTLSFLYTLEEYAFFIWAIIAIASFRMADKNGVKKILTTFFFILFSMLIFETGITYLQYIKHGVIGLTIEKQTTIPTFGFGADETSSLFRPIGLSYHANTLANWYVQLFCTFILIWLLIKNWLSKKISNFAITSSLVLTGSVIILTVSRSAYLSLTVFILILLIFNYRTTIKAFKFIFNYLKKFKIHILIVCVFFAYLITTRFYYSLAIFSNSGGFSTRISQMPTFKIIAKSSPFFGIGNGMYIPVSYYLDPHGFAQYFPEQIHNGFLLFLAERGSLPIASYVIGVFFLIRSLIMSKYTKTFKIVAISGLFSTYFMMLFQPFSNLFSLNILVLCIMLNTKKGSWEP